MVYRELLAGEYTRIELVDDEVCVVVRNRRTGAIVCTAPA